MSLSSIESRVCLERWLSNRGFVSDRHTALSTEALEHLLGYATVMRQTIDYMNDAPGMSQDIPGFVAGSFKEQLAPLVEQLFAPPQLKKEK